MTENASATLVRLRKSNQGTEGLFICSRFNCYSLELPRRKGRSVKIRQVLLIRQLADLPGYSIAL